jgi:hypothetical protein
MLKTAEVETEGSCRGGSSRTLCCEVCLGLRFGMGPTYRKPRDTPTSSATCADLEDARLSGLPKHWSEGRQADSRNPSDARIQAPVKLVQLDIWAG